MIFSLVFMGFASLVNNTEFRTENLMALKLPSSNTLSHESSQDTAWEDMDRGRSLSPDARVLLLEFGLHCSLVGSRGVWEAMRLSEVMNAFLPRVLVLLSRDCCKSCLQSKAAPCVLLF